MADIFVFIHASHFVFQGSTRSASSGGAVVVRLTRAWPILIEVLKIAPTGMTPPSLCFAIAAKPMEAMHPHELQSGLPPN